MTRALKPIWSGTSQFTVRFGKAFHNELMSGIGLGSNFGNLFNAGFQAFKKSLKKVPNPYGRLGSPAHRAKVAQVVGDLRAEGKQILYGPGGGEVYIRTPGGTKGGRFADVVALDPVTGRLEIHQIGRVSGSGRPVSREIKALTDIKRFAEDPRYRYAKRFFHKYEP